MSLRSTSIESYKRLVASGRIRGLRKQVCDVLAGSECPMTASEICQRLSGRQINSVNKRVGELRDMGMLLELEKRHCTVTNQVVYTYDLSGKDPEPLDKQHPPRRYWIIVDAGGTPVAVRPYEPSLVEAGYSAVPVREIRSKPLKS